MYVDETTSKQAWLPFVACYGKFDPVTAVYAQHEQCAHGRMQSHMQHTHTHKEELTAAAITVPLWLEVAAVTIILVSWNTPQIVMHRNSYSTENGRSAGWCTSRSAQRDRKMKEEIRQQRITWKMNNAIIKLFYSSWDELWYDAMTVQPHDQTWMKWSHKNWLHSSHVFSLNVDCSSHFIIDYRNMMLKN